MANPLKMIFGSRNDRVLRRIKKTVKKINALEEDIQALDNDALRAKTQEFRDRYQAGESLDDLLPEALLSCVRVASGPWACAILTFS